MGGFLTFSRRNPMRRFNPHYLAALAFEAATCEFNNGKYGFPSDRAYEKAKTRRRMARASRRANR